MSTYASRASRTGLGGPPAPAHMVSSNRTGPRGLNGASPFIWAHPERDVDSTPAASPTSSSLLRMACAIEMAPVRDDAQNRLMVTAVSQTADPAGSAPP